MRRRPCPDVSSTASIRSRLLAKLGTNPQQPDCRPRGAAYVTLAEPARVARGGSGIMMTVRAAIRFRRIRSDGGSCVAALRVPGNAVAQRIVITPLMRINTIGHQKTFHQEIRGAEDAASWRTHCRRGRRCTERCTVTGTSKRRFSHRRNRCLCRRPGGHRTAVPAHAHRYRHGIRAGPASRPES